MKVMTVLGTRPEIIRLSRLIPKISAEFGLSVTQLEGLAPHHRDHIQKAATAAGALLVGKLVTRELLLKLARHAGIRLTAKQATKYVPVAGQMVSAAIGYAALRALGELHIRDCVQVAQSVRHLLPSPDTVESIAPSEAAPRRRLGWPGLRWR